MPAAQFHEPSARHIENAHRQNPHCINKRQTVTVSCRSLREVGNDSSMKVLNYPWSQDSEAIT